MSSNRTLATSRMYETPNKLLEAALELGLSKGEFRQAKPGKWREILKQILDKFADTYKLDVSQLWSHLKCPGTSVQTENGLECISSLVDPGTNVWLLVEDWDRTKKQGNYWVFEGSYGAVIRVLNNMHCVEYYIVDLRLNWMILENHHDILVGVGEVAEIFILSLKANQKTLERDSH